jgi:hypothetical protein
LGGAITEGLVAHLKSLSSSNVIEQYEVAPSWQGVVEQAIAHPPPTRWYGRILGSLAKLGEAPLEEHPIALHPLPGRAETYTSQRNFLMLARRDQQWVAWWDLEDSGATETLAIG